MRTAELNDEIIAIGEAIVDQFAEKVGPDKANDAFHEWNDTVYDICASAAQRDRDGTLGTSALRKPLEFLREAEASGAMAREETMQDLIHTLLQNWKRESQGGGLMGYGDSVPIRAQVRPHAQPTQNYIEFTANVPVLADERVALFLITAQVREVAEQLF